MANIVFTGGGSAGHVTPNLALIADLRRKGWAIDYIGSADGIEKGILEGEGVPFHAISSGKLRRYFDLKNFKDPFKVVKGVFDAYRHLGRLKPDLVFSKGGFVAVPVVVAARLRGIPVLIHESDITPGLANKLSIPFARTVCVAFPEAAAHIAAGKAKITGLPIRQELKCGKRERGLAMCEFVNSRPVLFVMGGSLGAQAINQAVRQALPELLPTFQIIHICGKGHRDASLEKQRGYRQFEFVSQELPDLMAAADVVVSRAGATSLFEFLTLRKPMVLIPLTLQASRGDQILNARSFAKEGLAAILEEEQLTAETLAAAVRDVYARRDVYRQAQEAKGTDEAADVIVRLIEETAGRPRK